MSQPALLMSTRRPHWLPLTDLACTTLAAVLWLAFPIWGAWPLLLAVVPWLLRLWQTGRLSSCTRGFMTPLAAPLWLFMITAVVALWAAYNPTAAWAKFWLLLAAMFLFYSLANQPPAQLWFIAKLLSLLPLLIAAYFLLTHDWQANPTYISLLDRLAESWQAIRPSLPPFASGARLAPIHPNQAAGLIIAFAPLGLALSWRGWRTWPVLGQSLALLAALLLLFALLMTGSRAAWLALAAALAFWAWSPLSQRLAPFSGPPNGGDEMRGQPRIFRLGLFLALTLIVALLALFPALPLNLANRLPGAATAGSRAAIYSNTLYLLTDFPFTGAGLDAFSGLYSQYILVIPQRIFTYAHNLFLDVALEQGILGLAALLAILIGSLWLLSLPPSVPPTGGDERGGTLDHPDLLRWAVAAGLLALIGHGLADDAFYANRGTPLLWLLPGLAVALSRVGKLTSSRATIKPTTATLLVWRWPILALILLSSLTFILARPPGRAAWLANLAALQMARVELADWPTNQWADGQYLPALHPAEQRFIRALALHPANRTAHYRLGLIAILRQDFATAITHLEAAIPPNEGGHPGIRKALAYTYLWAGQPHQAQPLLAHIPEAKHELAAYTSWWRTQERPDLARRAQQMLEYLSAS